MHRSDFTAVLRRSCSSIRRSRGAVRAVRAILWAYTVRTIRLWYRDPERFWDSLERWADRRWQRPRGPLEDPLSFTVERVVLRRFARTCTELAFRYPNEPERRRSVLDRLLLEG